MAHVWRLIGPLKFVMQAFASPYVVLEDASVGGALLFDQPEAIIVARHPGEVDAAFAAMDKARQAGLHLVGYAAFELGYVLEPHFGAHFHQPKVPYLLFGAFKTPKAFDWSQITPAAQAVVLAADWSYAHYQARIGQVLDYIRAGDVYQINLTFPMRGRFQGNPLALFAAMRRRQPVTLGGVIALDDQTILSASPELFFTVHGREISAKPMKGTAPRSKNPAEDAKIAAALQASIKDRAENVMIVDLLRNDLSRLSRVGSVKVPKLFEIESYPTLHQMTSTVTAELHPNLSLRDIFAGLFPCGSVTGAPKIRAMGIIHELEPEARGAYCGSIGHISPNGDMKFNVAIRTATLRGEDLVFNAGSGVVYDSEAKSEWDECHLKASFMSKTSA